MFLLSNFRERKIQWKSRSQGSGLNGHAHRPHVPGARVARFSGSSQMWLPANKQRKNCSVMFLSTGSIAKCLFGRWRRFRGSF